MARNEAVCKRVRYHVEVWVVSNKTPRSEEVKGCHAAVVRKHQLRSLSCLESGGRAVGERDGSRVRRFDGHSPRTERRPRKPVGSTRVPGIRVAADVSRTLLVIDNVPRAVWLHPNKRILVVWRPRAVLDYRGGVRLERSRPVWRDSHPQLFTAPCDRRVGPEDHDHRAVAQHLCRGVVLNAVPTATRPSAVVIAQDDPLHPRPVDHILGRRHRDVPVRLWVRVLGNIRQGVAAVNLPAAVGGPDVEQQVIAVGRGSDKSWVVVKWRQNHLGLCVGPAGVCPKKKVHSPPESPASCTRKGSTGTCS
eukprot:m.16782 g.16782  ORF g.16782 m.16782 type:complete len:306 (-) comp9105_c0_seq1:286-1203(-)